MSKYSKLWLGTFLSLACSLLPLAARQGVPAVRMPQCERISRALDHYRSLAAQDDGTPLPATDDPVRPGDSYDGLPRLVQLLSLLGDLPEDAAPADSQVYEGELVEAVKRFQSRHALQPDGVIGPATLDQLNTPLKVRVRQLELALERWRRQPFDPRRPAIVLNIPEFRLRAYGTNRGGDQEPELEMKVVVGEAAEHRSPVLQSQLELVILRPYWTVPVSIQRNELIPEISRDRGWVSANNFEVVNLQGEVVPTGRVSDHVLAELSAGRLQLRQKPGPKNTLGLVKFMFPNPFGIYMHDTSARSLFDRERRDLSHGCIRVENPEDLAVWILRGQAGWSRERIESAIGGSQPTTVRITRPVQLSIMYATAAVMNNGEVHFFPDIYGEDEAFERQLSARRR